MLVTNYLKLLKQLEETPNIDIKLPKNFDRDIATATEENRFKLIIYLNCDQNLQKIKQVLKEYFYSDEYVYTEISHSKDIRSAKLKIKGVRIQYAILVGGYMEEYDKTTFHACVSNIINPVARGKEVFWIM